MDVSQFYTSLLAICAFITTLSVALNWVFKWISEMKKPAKLQDSQISANAEHLEQVDKRIDRDEAKLKQLEEQNRLTIEALFALLGHALDGNNEAEMKKVKNNIQKFLIEK